MFTKFEKHFQCESLASKSGVLCLFNERSVFRFPAGPKRVASRLCYLVQAIVESSSFNASLKEFSSLTEVYDSKFSFEIFITWELNSPL